MKTKETIQKGGIYKLVIGLSKDKRIKIGKLGTFVFLNGFYVYTGSAQSGFEKRIDRHLSSKKKFHWHIDYLLSHAKVIKVLRYVGSKDECGLSQVTGQSANAIPIVKRFGSSDCNCVTHLYYFKNPPTHFSES